MTPPLDGNLTVSHWGAYRVHADGGRVELVGWRRLVEANDDWRVRAVLHGAEAGLDPAPSGFRQPLARAMAHG